MKVSGQGSFPGLFTTGLIALLYMSNGWLPSPHGLHDRCEEQGNYFVRAENLFPVPRFSSPSQAAFRSQLLRVTDKLFPRSKLLRRCHELSPYVL